MRFFWQCLQWCHFIKDLFNRKLRIDMFSSLLIEAVPNDVIWKPALYTRKFFWNYFLFRSFSIRVMKNSSRDIFDGASRIFPLMHACCLSTESLGIADLTELIHFANDKVCIFVVLFRGIITEWTRFIPFEFV